MKRLMLGLMFAVCMVMLLSSPILAQEKPIRILSLFPMSGGMKASSEQWTLAEKVAIEEVNAQGGIKGRKIELIIEDSQLKPEIAVSKAQKYLLDGKVDVIIGAGSNVVKPLQDLVKQYNILLVMAAHADEETGKNFNNNSVRLAWNTSMLARAIVGYAAKYLPEKKKFYLLNQDYAYGRDFAANYKKELARQIPGSQVVGEDYHPVMSKDLSPYLTKVKMSGADVILSCSWGLDASVMVKQRLELGVKALLLSPTAVDPAVIAENPDASLGNHGCDTWFPTSTSKESLDFIESWKRIVKNPDHPLPNGQAAREYIATKFLLEGIKKAGSTEVSKVIPALESIKMKAISGDVYMRACDHQLIMPLQCASVTKKTAPYFGEPVTIPSSVNIIAEQDVDNARCKRK
jgi:branched-chain amino acid transport system substrate-binding protein